MSRSSSKERKGIQWTVTTKEKEKRIPCKPGPVFNNLYLCSLLSSGPELGLMIRYPTNRHAIENPVTFDPLYCMPVLLVR